MRIEDAPDRSCNRVPKGVPDRTADNTARPFFPCRGCTAHTRYRELRATAQLGSSTGTAADGTASLCHQQHKLKALGLSYLSSRAVGCDKDCRDTGLDEHHTNLANTAFNTDIGTKIGQRTCTDSLSRCLTCTIAASALLYSTCAVHCASAICQFKIQCQTHTGPQTATL